MNLSTISSDTIVLLLGMLAGFFFKHFIAGVKQCPLHQGMHDSILTLKNTVEHLIELLQDFKEQFSAVDGVWSRFRSIEDRLTILETKAEEKGGGR
jgi:hypothetical protein